MYAISLRCFGTTWFLDNKASRTGSFSALAQDVLDFTDRLDVAQFAIIGHDWGGLTAYTLSCLRGTKKVSTFKLSHIHHQRMPLIAGRLPRPPLVPEKKKIAFTSSMPLST